MFTQNIKNLKTNEKSAYKQDKPERRKKNSEVQQKFWGGGGEKGI
jgi:hypothetical protein